MQSFERKYAGTKWRRASQENPCSAEPHPHETDSGGNAIGARKTVIAHQMIKITTITVVMAMICNAFWLDS